MSVFGRVDAMSVESVIAVNRFGLGARLRDNFPARPKQWLLRQFDLYDPVPRSQDEIISPLSLMAEHRRKMRTARKSKKPDQVRRELLRIYNQQYAKLYVEGSRARLESALSTESPLVERLVHFWSNHFSVSAGNITLRGLVAAFEREAIRPHVLGSFSDMLLAVEQHPAMLIYLNQINSLGPNAPLTKRSNRKKARYGLNENLGRETLELHTLGARSGYSQEDVIEYAKALTGWSVNGIGPGKVRDDLSFEFVFNPDYHEPGSRTVLGRTYRDEGEGQARSILMDLATAPETARHVAYKIAVHFASDNPPKTLVEKLKTSFLASGGNLTAVYQTLIEAPEVWDPSLAKFKSPWEWLVSGLRGVGHRRVRNFAVNNALDQLGQPMWRSGSPAGWGDTSADWLAPDALIRRVKFAPKLVSQAANRCDARYVAPRILSHALSNETTTQLARASSPTSSLALLMVSPEFLRR